MSAPASASAKSKGLPKVLVAAPFGREDEARAIVRTLRERYAGKARIYSGPDEIPWRDVGKKFGKGPKDYDAISAWVGRTFAKLVLIEPVEGFLGRGIWSFATVCAGRTIVWRRGRGIPVRRLELVTKDRRDADWKSCYARVIT